MQTINSKVIDMLKKECICDAVFNMYMKHIIIGLSGSYSFMQKEDLKEEIARLIEKHFPYREENVPLAFRQSGFDDENFSVLKSA